MPRYALVTGAAGDLGRATCVSLASDGWSLYVTDHPTQARALQVTSDACAARGADVVSATFDVTDHDAVVDSIGMLVAQHDTPTAVVANAGIQGDFAPVQEYDVEMVRHVLDVNVVGVFNTVAVASRLMIRAGSGGSIVALASMAGVNGAPNMPAYSASKAAVIGLVKAASRDLAPHAVRVNAVSPAFIGPGAMWENQVAQQAAAGSQYFASDPEVVAQQMIQAIPLRRYGSPAEVADVIAFLAGARSAYLTGVNIEIAGGAL
ncbi:MAG TPA: SDR family NAD(P)-dependent oxidoreductase [Thermoleophilaceae bacterium]|nr:SDR family NAD(P)-dependent oxidoreductase [Thermoleophilaceae bacterium]